MKFFNFLPKEDKFYAYLAKLSSKANLSAHRLKDYVESSDNAERAAISADISASKARAKEIIGAMTGELCRSFITPFDREDMQNFAHQLYLISKKIEKVVQRMELHGLAGAQTDFIRQTDVIVSEARVMDEMVSDLINKRSDKEITKKVQILHDLEQQGDDVLQELLKNLFLETREAKDLILRKDIYDMLEKVVDNYRNAAEVTLQIVLKYS